MATNDEAVSVMFTRELSSSPFLSPNPCGPRRCRGPNCTRRSSKTGRPAAASKRRTTRLRPIAILRRKTNAVTRGIFTVASSHTGLRSLFKKQQRCDAEASSSEVVISREASLATGLPCATRRTCAAFGVLRPASTNVSRWGNLVLTHYFDCRQLGRTICGKGGGDK
eukprot:scaffold26147_cov31-Tisochrysis_lutea.AAC.1